MIILLFNEIVLSSDVAHISVLITKTRLFKYMENSTSKNWKFSDKKLW